MYDLVKPWANTDSIVVADSYFASVQAAIRLKTIGLRFIGTVKTATKEFPMAYLSSKIMAAGKGDRHGVLSTDLESGTSLMAFCWVDRDRRYFISTCSSLAMGQACVRNRWRQTSQVLNDDPDMVEVVVPQPEAASMYYKSCGKIDQHNSYRQSALMLETKLKTSLWNRRVNMSLLGMCIVDSFLLAQGCQHRRWKKASEFYEALAEGLIDNFYEQRALRKREARAMATNNNRPPFFCYSTGDLSAEKQLCSLTPTKRHKKGNVKHRAQGRCMSCRTPTSTVCRQCQQFQVDPQKQQFWIFRKPGMKCMGDHILMHHPDRADRPEGGGKGEDDCC